jgi:GTPase
MLVDEVYITVKAGNGGSGAVSFYPGGRKTGPDGGDGGDGGNVYVRTFTGMHDLHRYIKKMIYKAENGKNGSGFRRSGESGGDIELEMPVGTILIDQETREVIELNEKDQRVLICKGGKGGRGNNAFKSSINQAPKQFEPGEPGQERRIQVVLKLIADYGLIGLPNAGKSSLLNELTAAQAKTADYPFTTLEPNLGALNGKIIADIPGLIEGASKGRGLGFKFLKHIEKVSLLLHCVASDSADMEKDYNTIRQELGSYNASLLDKEEIILLTKADLFSPEEMQQKVKHMEQFGKSIMTLSIHDWDAIQRLKKLLEEK